MPNLKTNHTVQQNIITQRISRTTLEIYKLIIAFWPYYNCQIGLAQLLGIFHKNYVLQTLRIKMETGFKLTLFGLAEK